MAKSTHEFGCISYALVQTENKPAQTGLIVLFNELVERNNYVTEQNTHPQHDPENKQENFPSD